LFSRGGAGRDFAYIGSLLGGGIESDPNERKNMWSSFFELLLACVEYYSILEQYRNGYYRNLPWSRDQQIRIALEIEYKIIVFLSSD
jgi:hypothetical protein